MIKTDRPSDLSLPDGLLQTAVAFIIFNRPDQTARVFEAIRAARPAKLFLIADGPRADRPADAEKVRATRKIVANVDWPCTVLRNFSDDNLGCKNRVSSGLSWVFGQVPDAIVLEDDCLPSPAFFRFCDEMLNKYQEDRRVYSIAGSHFGTDTELGGHYLSDYALMWGWASWSDRWADYILDPQDAPRVLFAKWRTQPFKLLFWNKIFSKLVKGEIDTWDYQWILTTWRHAALTVRPRVNLVKNIGFGAGATHTTRDDTPLAAMIAHNPEASFAERHGPFSADQKQDRIDERLWALFSFRSILVLYFPFLSRAKAWTRL